MHGSTHEADARSSTFDWGYFTARCDELGASNDAQRAAKAGISIRTYYRLKAGEAALSLKRLDDMASNLKTTTARLMGLKA